ncbi:MAG: T9SS type A sorting domain-containing protein, partial [Bacteroidota bacterium]
TTDGNITENANTATPTVDAPGTYTMTVTNPSTGCTTQDEVTIEDSRIAPSGEFTAEKQALTIDVTAMVMDAEASYSWDMGDGTVLSGMTANHTYSEAGDYNVCLSFSNGCGTDQICNMQSVNAGFSLDTEIRHVDCFGGKNGAIVITPLNNAGDVQFVWSNGEMTSSISNLGAGQYTLVATDGAGTIIERTFVINEPEDIVQTGVDVQSTTGNQDNGSIAIDITGGVTPYTFRWSNGTETEVNNIDNLSPGEYTVTIVDGNDCEKQFGPFEVQASTNVNDIEILNVFDVYPNPAKEVISVKLEFERTVTGNISFINAMGQNVITQKIEGNQISNEYDISNLSSGIYMVTIETEEGIALKKIYKQ